MKNLYKFKYDRMSYQKNRRKNIMKNIKLSVLALMSVSSMAFAGGDIDAPVVQEEIPYTPDTPVVMGEKSNFYAGFALSALSVRESGATLNFASGETGADRIGNATLLAGYDINSYVAVEARYTTAITSDDKAKMSGISIFLKPQYEVSDELALYGLLGYGKVKIDSKNHSNVDVSKGGFQWGLGLSYDITPEISTFVEYASLAHNMDGTFLTDDSASVDALSIGLTYRF